MIARSFGSADRATARIFSTVATSRWSGRHMSVITDRPSTRRPAWTATITSGTTRENRDYQRDYVLTLELVEVGTGSYDKQSAELSKGYHHSRLSRWRATNPLKQ